MCPVFFDVCHQMWLFISARDFTSIWYNVIYKHKSIFVFWLWHPLWLILYFSVTMTYDFKMIVFVDFFSEAEKANRQGCVQAYLLTEKICPNYFFLTFVKNAIQVCMCFKCPCKFSLLVNVSFFSPKLLIVWKIFFSSFSLYCRQYILMVGHQIRLRGDDNFSSWQKKKGQDIFRSRIWACIFRIKWCTVGTHNAMARIGLETNSSGEVSWGKEIAPLLQ